VLEDVATLTALLAWTWLLLLVVATVLSALRGARLPHPQGLARHLAPRAAQQAVFALLGLGTALATTGTASAAAYDAPQQLAAAGLRGGVQASSGANPLEGLPLPDRPSGTSPPSSTTRDHHSDTVVVRRGDTLWSIAASAIGDNPSTAAIARSWPDWYAANRAVIGNDPDFLLPGTVLEAPRSATSVPDHPLPPDERS
jgi:nucleoid-associated protein YgaU